jgi:tripartite-type tricarboxylate transporter receptor subunit TctC
MKPLQLLVLAALSVPVAHAAEHAYPERPVRMVVPFPPGGANDIVARQIGQRLNVRWGKPVVIDNRGGAGGNIGTEIGARANPDGYTLLIGSTSTLASNMSLYEKLPFDVVRDFAPISLIVTAPNILCITAALPAKNLPELIRLAKASPQKFNYSSFGEGSSSHLIGEMFKRQAGIDMVHVPYKGGAQALTAVIGSEVQMTFANLSVALPQVRAGKLRGIAVTSVKRAAALPELPTVADSGLPGFEATAWVAIVAPRATPRVIVQQVNADIRAELADKDMIAQLAAQGLEPAGGTPEALGQHLRAEVELWRKVIREAGVRAQN